MRAGRSVATIGVALITSSVLGFLLLGLISRWLSPDQNASFLSIWGLVFGLGSVISAIEQEIARQATRASITGVPVPGSVLQLTVVALGVGVVSVLVLSLLPLRETLLTGSLWIMGLALLAVGGFAVQFMARGVFLGTNQIRRYAAVILLEALLRAVLAAGLFFGSAEPSLVWAVATITIGCFGWFPVIRGLMPSIDRHGGFEPWRRVWNRIGALALANGLSSLVLTAFPTLVTAVVGTSQGLATLFGAVTLSRVPLVLMSPVQAMVVPLATRAISEGRLHELRALQGRLAGAATVVAFVAGVLGYLLGPWAMRLFMGSQYDADPRMMAALLSSTVFMAVALIQAAVFIALERYWTVAASWLATVAATVTTLLVVPGPNAVRGSAGFAVASLVGYLVSGILLQRAISGRTPHPSAPSDAGEAPVPDSGGDPLRP